MLISLLTTLIFTACYSSRIAVVAGEVKSNVSSDVWVVSEATQLVGNIEVDRHVLVMPGGSFLGTDKTRLVFAKPVTILSNDSVFGSNITVVFKSGTLQKIDITWWGANGMDEEDDTHAIQRAFEVATGIGSVEIRIPLGRFYISSQLQMAGQVGFHQSLIVKGTSSSYDGMHGSSLIWNSTNVGNMLMIKNTSQTVFENLDFNAVPGSQLISNIEFRPSCNQISFKNCYFSGCTGSSSCNINLNEGNNLQVSELFFENCTFKGVLTEQDYSANAIKGGWANTKNFHFTNCAFGPYHNEAINIRTSDVLKIEGCTFYLNDVDISCETCKTLAISNYSEESGSFFRATASANFNSTTLINNQFTGKPKDGYVIRDGSGTLILMNNNFGGGNYLSDWNKVKWEENEFNSIYSVGNVFKNASPDDTPFYNRSNQPYRKDKIWSFGDLGGMLGDKRVKLPDSRN